MREGVRRRWRHIYLVVEEQVNLFRSLSPFAQEGSERVLVLGQHLGKRSLRREVLVGLTPASPGVLAPGVLSALVRKPFVLVALSSSTAPDLLRNLTAPPSLLSVTSTRAAYPVPPQHPLPSFSGLCALTILPFIKFITVSQVNQ